MIRLSEMHHILKSSDSILKLSFIYLNAFQFSNFKEVRGKGELCENLWCDWYTLL
jgi:hypothetical protein